MRLKKGNLGKALILSFVLILMTSGNTYAVVADENFDGAPVGDTGTQSYLLNGIRYISDDSGGANILIRDRGDIASSSDHALQYDSTDVGTSREIIFKTEDGSEFKLNSFVIGVRYGDPSVTISGYRDHAEVVSKPLTVVTKEEPHYSVFDVSENSDWGNIDEVRISGDDLYVEIDDLDFSDPVYTITYNGNGSTSGSVPTDDSAYLEGATVTVLGNTGTLVKTNSTFAGWNTASDGSGTDYASSATFAMGSSNVTLYAKWTQSVTYDANGSTSGSVPTDDSAYLEGATVTVLGNTGSLVKTNSTFAGWNTASDGSGTDYATSATFAMGSSNVILYAKWTQSVTYDGNGSTGGIVPTDDSAYLEGATVTVLGNTGLLVKPHYTFVGWNTASDGNGTDYAPSATFAMGSSHVTLYAKWTADPTYTITYNGNGNTSGTVPTDSASYYNGDSVTVLGNIDTLVKTNSTFAGWNTASDGSGTDYAPSSTFAMGGGNVTLYAKWTQSVTYDANGSTSGIVPTDGSAYLEGATVTVLGNTGSLVKTNSTFAGWNTASDGSGTDYAPSATFEMGTSNVTLYAKWTQSVTYDGNGSTGGIVPTDDSAYLEGATVTVLGNTGSLVKTHYTFVGWNTASDGNGTDYAPSATFAMGSSHVTLYAKWTADPTYTITYNGNGSTSGTVPTDSALYYNGDSVTVLGNIDTLVKTNSTFAGWNTASDGSGTDYAPSATFAMGGGNVTLYAKWTQSVTYDANGSTSGIVPTDSSAYLEGATVTVLGNTGSLVKTNSTFAGWNTASDGSGTDYAPSATFTMGTSNVTLYAKWTQKVTYDANGSTGGIVPTDSSAYLEGATVTVLGNTGSLVKTHYTFVGWNTASDGNGTDYVPSATFAMGSSHVTLYAKWTADPTYTITYNGNGSTSGTVPTDSASYYNGDSVTVLGNIGTLVKTNSTFAGWNTASDGSGTDYATSATFEMGTSNVTLYAKWTQKVTYDANGSTGGIVPTDSSAYLEGATVTVLGNTGSLVKTHYTFVGWNTASDGSGTDYVPSATFAMGSSHVILYAKWTADPTYTITYNGNGSTSGTVPTDSASYYNGDSVTVLGNIGTLVKTNSTFAGWNTASDGSGTDYAPSATFAMGGGNVTLYAKWTQSVTYDANGSTSGIVPTDGSAYLEGATVTVLGNTGSLAKTNSTFAGWNTASDGSGTDYAPSATFTMGSSHVTLYAKWTQSVTYDGNGSTGGIVPTDSSAYLEGATVTVLGNTGSLVKPHYTFVGWNTASDGNGTDYVPSATFAMGSSHVTLYAKWTADPTYTITYNGNGSTSGSVPTDGASYYNGDSVIVLGNTGSLEKTNSTFAGWNTASDGSGTDYATSATFEMGTSNVTLYAKWTQSVTYDANGSTGGIVPTDSSAYLEGATVTVLGNTGSLVKTHYTFVGWNTASDGNGTDYVPSATFAMGSSHVILYAKWTADPTYTITYNGNGSTSGSVPTDSASYYNGDSVIVLGNTGSLEKTNSTFAGWNTASDGSGTDYAPSSTFAMGGGNVTLYAKWTQSVTYDANGATSGIVPTDGSAYLEGATVTVLGNTGTLVKTNSTFAGWNTASDGSGTDYASSSTFTMGSSHVTLYAKWTQSVTYDGNGSTGGIVPTDSSAYLEGATVTVLGNTGSLVKPHYTFVGWNTASDGNGTDYVPSATFAMGSSHVTLYAKWTADPTYTITYNGNGSTSGSVPTDGASYYNGDSVIVLGNTGTLEKTNSTFAGWNTASDGSGTDYATSATFEMGTSNVTLYAKWTQSVTYDANGSTGGIVPTDSSAYLEGATVTVLGNTGSLVKTHYTFVGWNTASDGNGTDYVPSATFAMGSSHVTLYAKWTADPTYTITYNGNGSTSGSVPTDSASYYNGDSVIVLGNTGSLEKTNSTFAGWNTASDGSGTDYAPSATFAMGGGNVTLYAKWTQSVTYDANGSTSGIVPTDSSAYLEGATVTVLGNTGTLVKTNSTFAGWNTASDGSGTDYAPSATFTMGTSNVTLYAKWTQSVTYDGNGSTGGIVPTDSSAYLEGATVTVLGNTGSLVKTHYTFVGWNTASDGNGTDYVPSATFAMGSSHVTLYAKWTVAPTYTIAYNGNGNTSGSVPTDGASYYNGDSVTVLGNTGTLVKANSTFAGWNTASDGSGTDYAPSATFAMGGGNVTLYAKWTQSVTYDANGSTSGTVPTDSSAYLEGATVTVLGNTGSLVRTHYTFVGWNTASDGSGTDYVPSATFAMGSSHVTLYAKWTADPTYTITYNGNGSTSGTVPTDSSAYLEGATVTVLGNTGSLVKTHYTFVGWNTASDGSGTDYAPSATFAMGSSHVTLYAKWTAAPTYTVTYNGNGSTSGSVPVDSTAYHMGDSVTVSSTTGSMVKAGYTFTSWNTSANGSGTRYTPGSTFIMGSDNVTLYAQWKLNATYTVTYIGNGNTSGIVPVDSKSYQPGDTVTVLNTTGSMVKAGYSFVTWNTASDGSGTNFAPGSTFMMGTSDALLYAKWQKDKEDKEETKDPNSETGNNNTPPNGGSTPPASTPKTEDASILVNGQNEKVGEAVLTIEEGKTVKTVLINPDIILQKLESEGNEAVITIPIKGDSQISVGKMTGQMINDMEAKETILKLETESASYTLPARQIDINTISNQLGENIRLSDISVTVEISKPTEIETQFMENAADEGNYTVVMPPISFEVNCEYEGRTVKVENFNAYVERRIAIPAQIDPTKVTTAVAYDEDGNIHHVPTKVEMIDGIYYAIINSLTNSNYTLIYKEKTFEDIKGHWARKAIDEMSSRMIVAGVTDTNFEPDRAITRAEAVTILVKGLGLKERVYRNEFSDVNNDQWFSGYVSTANQYGIIKGYEDGTFRPNQKITREEAISIVAAAVKIVDKNQSEGLDDQEIDLILSKFMDRENVSNWSAQSVATCTKLGIVKGNNQMIRAKENIKRSEVTVLIREMLKVFNLI